MVFKTSQPSNVNRISEPDDFVRSFLFGTHGIVKEGQGLRSVLLMDDRTQGWVGIPHGGIAMGAMADMALALPGEAEGSFVSPPFSLDYRMGGASARLGDVLRVDMAATGEGAAGVAVKERASSPYLSATFRKVLDSSLKETFESYLPAETGDIETRMLPLPSYRNCFVCGIARREPGLERRFHSLEGKERQKIVVSPIGFAGDSGEAFYRFQRHGYLHPLPMLALIDEIMGWAGFLLTASGSVTVKASYTFYREVHVGERLMVFGRGDKTRGSAESRLLYWASGGAASIRNDGTMEPVVAASGQYLGVSALTEQMRQELLPADLTRRAFQLAGVSL